MDEEGAVLSNWHATPPQAGIPKVLILSKNLQADGGVVNVVGSLTKGMSGKIVYEHFEFSRSRKGKYGPLKLLSDCLRLAIRLRSSTCDWIHINPSFNWPSLLRDSALMVVMGVAGLKNILVFFHGWEAKVVEQIRCNRFLRWLFLRIWGRASRVLVLGSSFKRDLVGLGISESSVVVVTTMFDGRPFSGVRKRVSQTGPTLLFLSRFVKEKGIYELLDAFDLVARDHPGARLHMIGDGPEMIGIHRWVCEHAYQDRIHLPGYLRGREKAEALINADIFVFPTYYGEGCPISLLEAMAAGLPVVTTAVGGIPDVFREPENGIFLEKADPKAIATAINRLLEAPLLRKEIAKRNFEKAWSEFEASKYAMKLARYYE